MKVSVVVPVYNGEKTIGKAVDALLGQSLPHKEYEIIVVDDGSADGTLDVLKNYGRGLRVVKAGRDGGAAGGGGPGPARSPHQ